jgi:hypothetical protein
MKTLIKLLIVVSVLLSFNTAHAFWGDAGDTYISVATWAGEGAASTFDTQLKEIKGYKLLSGKFWVFGVPTHEITSNSLSISYSDNPIGWIPSSKDIEKVKKYLKK